MTIYAQWQQIYKDYTIIFNANGGCFDGDVSITEKEQTYHYGDTITPPDDPTKAEDDDFTYEFTGWNPTLAPVTENYTYNAAYRATLKEGLPETGIIVSDGVNSEDINCNGALVSGYACELMDYSVPGGGTVQVPELTISGNGLTFSGSNDSVYVVIGSGCGSVTFEDLSLSGAYSARIAGNLFIEGDASDTITINISGSCELVNTSDNRNAVNSMRPIVLSGQGADPSLNISSVGRDAIYSTGLEVDSLSLSVTATGSSSGASTYAITGEDAGGDPVWRFVDSDVTARGMGAVGVYGGSVVLEGSSHVTFVSTDNDKAVLLAFGEDSMGYLRFVNFTGEFSASYQDAGATGPAVQDDDRYNLYARCLGLRSRRRGSSP